MAIQKYATTHCYGYGFYRGSTEYSAGGFYGSVEVPEFGKPSGVKVTPPPKAICLPRKYPSGTKVEEPQPLYLVQEDGIWREYFTGTQISEIDAKDGGFPGGGFRCDLWSERELKPVRKVVFGNPHVYEPLGFANAVAKYSDDEIKKMVRQFYRLQEDAVEWGRNFDNAIEQFRIAQDKWTRENVSRAAKLESGLGKYADVPKEDAMHKKGKRILVGIIIAVVIVLLLWCFK